MKKRNRGVTLIALVITIIVLLILAGITLRMVMGDSGIINKAQLSKENTNYESAKESLQVMLLEIKTRVITEEKRQTKITDLNELDGKDEATKIEYKSDEIASAQIALVTYRGYIFKIDDNLNILEESIDENYDEETLNYKKVIAKTLTDLGVETSYKQSAKDYIDNIKILADKNYEEGKESDIVLLKTDLSSRYEQTISLSNIEGYENFDDENFIIGNKNMTWIKQSDTGDFASITKSYNKKTGTLVLGVQKSWNSTGPWAFWNTYDLYAIKRKKKDNMKGTSSSNNSKESIDDFKSKLAKALEDYGIENSKENPIVNKTVEEISNYIRTIAINKFEEGVATYKVLVKSDLITRYNQTVSISNIENYQNLTIDDFLIVNKNMIWQVGQDSEEISIMTKNYDPVTGTLEFGKQLSSSGPWRFWNTYDVYLLKKKVINLEN